MRTWFGTYQWMRIRWIWPLVTIKAWLMRMLIIVMIFILGASKTEMLPSPLVMFPILIFYDVVHYPASTLIASPPFCCFSGTNHSWPLLGHPIVPTVGIRRTFAIEGWINRSTLPRVTRCFWAQKGNFLNIQASSSKRSTWLEEKKTWSSIVYLYFLVRAKMSD